MDFSGLKSLTIPEGSVKKITANGVTLWEKISFTNLLPLSIGSDKKPYNNGQGWKANTRLNSSGTETTQANIEVTGFMPVKRTDIVYLSGITIPYNGSNKNYQYFVLYDSSFKKIIGPKVDSNIGGWGATKYDSANNLIEINIDKFFDYYQTAVSTRDTVAYFRFSAEEITNDSIVTVNQPIP